MDLIVYRIIEFHPLDGNNDRQSDSQAMGIGPPSWFPTDGWQTGGSYIVNYGLAVTRTLIYDLTLSIVLHPMIRNQPITFEH